MARPEVIIRLIAPPEVVPLRHAVLWPSIPLDKQLMPYDHLPTTRHVGAFLVHPPEGGSLSEISLGSSSADTVPKPQSTPAPVGVLTLTLEPYPPTAPFPSHITPTNPARHVQLHKFAVAAEMQGRGIGRKMYEYVRELLSVDSDSAAHEEDAGATLLHLDARKSQRGLYERLGVSVLDHGVRIKRGPGDAGPPVEYIRMGEVIRPSGAEGGAVQAI